jgi:tetraprenyl-beta-curcumene synthase
MTNRWPLARAGFALLLANVRYWSTVAPLVRVQLARWEQAARAIEDPELQALALGKLLAERFNAQVAATLATLAPRRRRARVVEAIVALQILYDYLDVLGEQAVPEPTIDGRHLFTALHDAVTLDGGHGRGSHTDRDYYRDRPHSEDGGYLQALVDTVRTALGRLPATGAITAVAGASAQRCAEAQMLNHDASRSGVEEARRWATLQAPGTGLGWQELLAGASASVLAIDALIAAAAGSGTTHVDAEDLDALYLSIGALTMLDSIVDLQEDITASQLGYVHYYDSPELMAARLQCVARDAAARARRLPNGAHHIVTLVGVVAYYTSAPTANSELARSLTAPVRTELRPLITPTLALMRSWRLAKRVRRA